MPIYGYSKRVVSPECGLLEMREVTFSHSLADLRRIARFLLEFADKAESGEWRSSHRHLADFDRQWRSDHPQSDVIVVHPFPDPPMRVASLKEA